MMHSQSLSQFYAIASTPLALPSRYAWIILGGTLDILLTTVILALGGQEANPLANAILLSYGMFGMIVYKYILVGAVILGCEYIARKQINTAKRLAAILIAIHFAPVVWSTSLLAIYFG